MGAGSSAPAPPPRLAKTLAVSLAGVLDPVPSTMRLADLPPATTATAREGIALCAGLHRRHLYGASAVGAPTASGNDDADDDDDEAVAVAARTTLELVDGLVRKARDACNVRDYVTLLIEATMTRLSMDLGPPSDELVEVARFVNPLLHPTPTTTTTTTSAAEDEQDATSSKGGQGPSSSSVVTINPFRATDAALITDIEKDLLVLLYYCHVANIQGSPDEAIEHMAKTSERRGAAVLSDLATRAEPFLLTEVYIFWSLMFLASNLAANPPPSPAAVSRTRLEADHAVAMARLLAVCDMLVDAVPGGGGRLDEACFLLMFLRRLAARQTGKRAGWWRSKAKHVARHIAKSRPGRQAWHVEFVDRTVRALAKNPGMAEQLGAGGSDAEPWEGRNSLSFSRDDLGVEVDIWKGL